MTPRAPNRKAAFSTSTVPAGIEMVDPVADLRWGALATNAPFATVFHSPAWIRVLKETYGFDIFAVVAIDNDQPRAGIAVARLGSRLVALPFSDYWSPLFVEPASIEETLSVLKAQVPEGGVLEIRGTGLANLVSHGFQEGKSFYQHRLRLDRPFAQIEAGFHSSAKRAIRKAVKEGVSVRKSRSEADMAIFYDLVVQTRRKQGLLPQPWSFFQGIQRHLFEPGAGCLLLAEHGGRVIGGDLLLQHADTLTYKFNASDPAALELRPNNLLIESAVRLGVELGCRELDLGRCDLDADGLRRFKLLWGCDEETTSYYFYPGQPAGGKRSLLNDKILPPFSQHAPIWLLKKAADLLYRRFA